MSEVKWIKIVTNIFDDEKIRFIETLPNGDEIIVIWFKILCLTGKSNSDGFLMFTDKLAYTDELLASIFQRDIKSIKLALNTFENLGMVELIDNKIYVTNWDKHQNVDGMERIREQTRQRVANHRERKKLECNVTSNATVTLSNATDIEEDKEEDKDIIKPKKTYVSVIDDFTTDIQLRTALYNFKDMRQKQKGFTINALELNLKKLKGMTTSENEMTDIVNQSVMNGWKSFYEIKDKSKIQKRMPKYEDADYSSIEEDLDFSSLQDRLSKRG